jgi:hypothetical protein
MRWVGNVAHMGKNKIEYRRLIAKAEGKRPLGRYRHRWEVSINIGFKEIG